LAERVDFGDVHAFNQVAARCEAPIRHGGADAGAVRATRVEQVT
jgi:hypothetical protein